MRRNWTCLFALVGLLACAAPGQAQLFIRAPFVRVAVGQPAWPGGPAPVFVRAPFFQFTSPGPGPVFIGSPAPYVVGPPVIVPPVAAPYSAAPASEPLGRPTPLPPAPVPVPQTPGAPAATTTEPPTGTPGTQVVPTRAMTLQEFANGFRPAAGRYQVTLLHPRTNRPVTVAFTLPEGTPRVRLTNREVDFDYGRQEVEIRFLLGGRVEVSYRD